MLDTEVDKRTFHENVYVVVLGEAKGDGRCGDLGRFTYLDGVDLLDSCKEGDERRRPKSWRRLLSQVVGISTT